jgi:hypothetical protein
MVARSGDRSQRSGAGRNCCLRPGGAGCPYYCTSSTNGPARRRRAEANYGSGSVASSRRGIAVCGRQAERLTVACRCPYECTRGGPHDRCHAALRDLRQCR